LPDRPRPFPVLTSPDASSLFAISIVRIALDATADGRAAELDYGRLETTATAAARRTTDDVERAVRVGAGFAGEVLAGRIGYRLLPRDDGTELVQHLEYEFDDPDGIDVAEAATATHNDRQFAPQLAALREFLESGPGEDRTERTDNSRLVSLVFDR
jgi:putative N-acetylmannosamine-6-phosphate epimerase